MAATVRITPGGRESAGCVICGGDALQVRFRLTGYQGQERLYEECRGCGSLQIRQVDWLDTLYTSDPLDIDTGSVQRCLIAGTLVRSLVKAGVVPAAGQVLDFGSGSGLLVRLLRDQGLDARGYDLYSRPNFAATYKDPEPPGPGAAKDLIVAIEVFEHLPDPAGTVGDLCAGLKPRGALLLSTGLYDADSHDQSWGYLYPSQGQHINFASRGGMRHLAQQNGRHAVFLPAGMTLMMPQAVRWGGLRRLRFTLAYALAKLGMKASGQGDFRGAARDNIDLYREL